jgi:hypothetical protein
LAPSADHRLQLCRTVLDEWANQNSVIDSKRQRVKCLRPAVLRDHATERA